MEVEVTDVESAGLPDVIESVTSTGVDTASDGQFSDVEIIAVRDDLDDDLDDD